MVDAAIRGVWKTPDATVPREPDEVDALARFGRLASIGQSAESIAFQMADLLAAIQARCDLALAPAGDAERDLGEAKRLAVKCAELVGRLLSFTQGREGRWSCSLRRVIDRMSADLSLRAADVAPVEIDIEEDVRVACPPTQLQQALQHLVTFARDTIGRSQGRVVLRARATSRYLTLEVLHDGPGIPDALRDRLFEPFAASQRGLGLELYIARCIVERYDGLVGLFSSPERGTTFRVVLPTVVASK